MRKIALIDVSSLESLAIRSILEGYPGIHARSFVSLDEIRGTDDSFECFIASVEELLRNLDFFLPRRNRGCSNIARNRTFCFRFCNNRQGY